MAESVVHDSPLKQLLDRMVAARQLSSIDAKVLTVAKPPVKTEEEALRWLAQEYGLAFTTLDDIEPDRQLLSLFPARILLKEELLPLQRTNGTVEIATSRLFATQGLDALKTMTGLNLKPVLASSEALQREIKKRLGVGADTIGTLDEEKGFQVVDENAEDTNLDEAAEDEASIIRFVNQVLKDAIELRASDIHLEPFEDEFRIRYRIDGELQEVPVPAQLKRFQPAIVSRVKILSHLNIAEKRLPQDGRIKIRLDDADVDIRVSVIPMLHGEAVVMRLLRQNSTLRGMGELDMDQRELDCFQRVLQLPHGIILVTGPTGSGKTSTLYTALNAINDAARKIITIEDPVEYQLKGVNQIRPHLRARTALDFAPRSGRGAHRRNSRPGNGADRRPGLAHRPFGLFHAAHQRRARRGDAARGHGRRAVSRRLVARGRARATPRPRALQALQGAGQFAHRPGAQGAARHPAERDHLQIHRLPRMPQHRIFRTARHF
jgi:general secretion pathway protein E/type IV pilus assembly protein PilB